MYAETSPANDKQRTMLKLPLNEWSDSSCMSNSGGGFSLAREDLGEHLMDHSLPAHSKKKRVEISLHTPIPLFMPVPDPSGSVSWVNCGWAFPGKLCVSSFPWQVPILCLDSRVSPLWLCCFKGVLCQVVTCHLHFWHNDWDLLPW